MTVTGAVLGGLALVANPKLRRTRVGPREVALGLASAAALYGTFKLGDRFARRFVPGGDDQIRDIYSLRELAPRSEIALRLATIIGPAEELFWRGLVQEALMRRYGRWTGAAMAAVAYSAVHVTTGNFTLMGAAGSRRRPLVRALCGGRPARGARGQPLRLGRLDLPRPADGRRHGSWPRVTTGAPSLRLNRRSHAARLVAPALQDPGPLLGRAGRGQPLAVDSSPLQVVPNRGGGGGGRAGGGARASINRVRIHHMPSDPSLTRSSPRAKRWPSPRSSIARTNPVGEPGSEKEKGSTGETEMRGSSGNSRAAPGDTPTTSSASPRPPALCSNPRTTPATSSSVSGDASFQVALESISKSRARLLPSAGPGDDLDRPAVDLVFEYLVGSRDLRQRHGISSLVRSSGPAGASRRSLGPPQAE